jgi:hypothetical protein
VKRLSMLVTAKGEWVFEDSAEFLAALRDSNPDYDAASFAVKNLGFIKFQILDDSIIEIELHPRNVELPALLAVQQQLLSSRVNLFRIKYFETSWRSEITFTAERAISQLAELFSPVFAAPPSRRFLAEPRDFSRLAQDPDNPFSPMVHKWRMSFGFFDSTVIAFAIKQQLLSRMMIIAVTPHRADPIFRFIGDGFPWTDYDYKIGAIGRRIEEQPDKEYGAWVSEFYKFRRRQANRGMILLLQRFSVGRESQRATLLIMNDCCCHGKHPPKKYLSRCCQRPSMANRRNDRTTARTIRSSRISRNRHTPQWPRP